MILPDFCAFVPLKPEYRYNRDSIVKAINNKSKNFVYQFGSNPGTGFSADYCWFLTQLIKCLQFEIGFSFGKVSKPIGFSVSDGWSDYFEPFCDIANAPYLQALNIRPFPFSQKLPYMQATAKSFLRIFTQPSSHYFMFDNLGELHELSEPFFEKGQSFVSACQEIINCLWVYNLSTQNLVNKYKQSTVVPHDYVAICVRRGDKIVEHNYVTLEAYVSVLRQITRTSKFVFVATDDHSVISELTNIDPDHTFLSITPTELMGYDHKKFSNLPAKSRAENTARFFSQVEFCRDASYFVGSKTTNVSHLINFHRGGSNVVWIENT